MNGPEPIVVTGCHAVSGDPRGGDAVLPWLVSRKSRKFMGKQDELAVIAAGHALQAAGLLGTPRLQAAAVYLTVGHIPFERTDIEAIARHSVDADGAFSMRSFSLEGIEQVNPLLTFRCLPNMPAYHLSVNFDIRGSYLIGYPGIAQCYAALQQACDDLHAGRQQHALLAAVADQRNFLVDFHFARSAERSALPLSDAAGVICLEREHTARERGAPILARLLALETVYRPDADAPEAATPLATLLATPLATPPLAASCADLALGLQAALARAHWPWDHAARSLDHCRLASRWGAP